MRKAFLVCRKLKQIGIRVTCLTKIMICRGINKCAFASFGKVWFFIIKIKARKKTNKQTPTKIPSGFSAFLEVLRYVLAESEFRYRAFFLISITVTCHCCNTARAGSPFLRGAISSLQLTFHSRKAAHEKIHSEIPQALLELRASSFKGYLLLRFLGSFLGLVCAFIVLFRKSVQPVQVKQFGWKWTI